MSSPRLSDKVSFHEIVRGRYDSNENTWIISSSFLGRRNDDRIPERRKIINHGTVFWFKRLDSNQWLQPLANHRVPGVLFRSGVRRVPQMCCHLIKKLLIECCCLAFKEDFLFLPFS